MTGRVRFSEIDEQGYLSLHHLINYFQDCSTFHLEDLGLGSQYFKSQDLTFYVLSWQIEINRLPTLGEKIKVETQIYDCKGVFGYRNYFLLTEDDEMLAYANLCGCFINSKTGSFVKLSPEEIAKYPIEKGMIWTIYLEKLNHPSQRKFLMQSIFISIKLIQIDMSIIVSMLQLLQNTYQNQFV